MARAAPEEALGAVEDLNTDVHGSAAVLKGVGDGVAESRALESLSDWLVSTCAERPIESGRCERPLG